jgi:hypothetical protein
MHSLSKMLFFTTGAVSLLFLVFIWSVLHYGLFSLDHLIHGIINFKLLGYSLPEYLNLSENNGIGRNVHLLKIIASSLVLAGSSFCVLVSYLPKVSWQLRTTSFVLSIFLLSCLLLFWSKLIEGDQIIEERQISTLFSITLILYLGGVFGLWYSLRTGGRARNIDTPTLRAPVSPMAPPPAKILSAEKVSSDEGNDASNFVEKEEGQANTEEKKGDPEENQTSAGDVEEQDSEEPESSSGEGKDSKKVTPSESEDEEASLEGERDASRADEEMLEGQLEADMTATDSTTADAEFTDTDGEAAEVETETHTEEAILPEPKV